MSIDTRASDADLIVRSLTEPGLFTAVFDRHSAEILRYVYAPMKPVVLSNDTAPACVQAPVKPPGQSAPSPATKPGRPAPSSLPNPA